MEYALDKFTGEEYIVVDTIEGCIGLCKVLMNRYGSTKSYWEQPDKKSKEDGRDLKSIRF